MKENIKKQYLSLSSLKQRGWSESIIKNMCLLPDKEVTNPYYKSASTMKLYDLHKVEALEEADEFRVLLEKAENRKKSSAKAVNTKMQKMKEFVHSIEIVLPEYSNDTIYRKAVRHYNEYHFPYKYIVSYEAVDRETLIRITSNMIRHTLTDYEEILRDKYGKVGIDYAHDYLKKRIDMLVREKYF